MIRIVTSATADQAFLDAVLVSVPRHARVEFAVSQDLPAQTAQIETTSAEGLLRRVVAVADARRVNVVRLLDAVHAKRIVQIPAATPCLSRLLAEAV